MPRAIFPNLTEEPTRPIATSDQRIRRRAAYNVSATSAPSLLSTGRRREVKSERQSAPKKPTLKDQLTHCSRAQSYADRAAGYLSTRAGENSRIMKITALITALALAALAGTAIAPPPPLVSAGARRRLRAAVTRNISARHIRAIVPALSPAPRDALTETPIPASWSVPAKTFLRTLH